MGYRGELMMAYKRRDKEPYNIKEVPYQVGDRVAQMVVLPYPNVALFESDKLSETERGEGGFGSTGSS